MRGEPLARPGESVSSPVAILWGPSRRPTRSSYDLRTFDHGPVVELM